MTCRRNLGLVVEASWLYKGFREAARPRNLKLKLEMALHAFSIDRFGLNSCLAQVQTTMALLHRHDCLRREKNTCRTRPSSLRHPRKANLGRSNSCKGSCCSAAFNCSLRRLKELCLSDASKPRKEFYVDSLCFLISQMLRPLIESPI